jgi:RHS repeat-associated protein
MSHYGQTPGQGGTPRGQLRRGGDTGGTDPPTIPGTAFYFHQDHLSSTAVLTDEYGEVHEVTGYFPDGATWYEQGPKRPINGYLFSGKLQDPDTGLYDFGQRFYDPNTSLWLGVDPAFTEDTTKGIGQPMMLASLAYAGHSPILLVDPDGRESKFFWHFIDSTFLSPTADTAIRLDNKFGIEDKAVRFGQASEGFLTAAAGCAGSGGALCLSAIAYGADRATSGITGQAGLVDRGAQAIGVDPNLVHAGIQGAVGGAGLAAASKSGAPLAGNVINMEDDVARAAGGGGELIEVHRGVRPDPRYSQFDDALEGVARPHGGHSDPLRHQMGDTASEYTSWTTSHRTARQHASQGDATGIVITTKVPVSRTTRPPLNLGEDEVLIRGTVTGAKRTW